MATATKKTSRKKPKARKPAKPTKPAADSQVELPITPRSTLNDTFEFIAIDLIDISGQNERQEFAEEELRELAESIEQHGLIEPIVVRPSGSLAGGRFELIAGERRLRAVRELGWVDVEAKIVQADDAQAAALRLIENLHRVDLNAIEKATGYRALIELHGYTQAQLGELLKRNQSTISNALRMLKLPESWQRRIMTGEIPESHSRVLLKFADSPRVLAAIEDEFFNDGVNCQDIGTREQFSEVCDDVALSVTKPVGAHTSGGGPNLVWSSKLGRQVQAFEPTPEQCDQLELIELGSEVRAANTELWQELQEAHEAALAETAAEEAEASAADGDRADDVEWDGSEPEYDEPMQRHPDEPRANEHGILDTDVETIEIPFPKSHRCEATIELAQDSEGKWYFGVHASWANGGFGYAPHWAPIERLDTRKAAALEACEALLAARDGKRHPNDEIPAERYRKVISRFKAEVVESWDDQASPPPEPTAAQPQAAKPAKKAAASGADPVGRLKEDVKVWRANWLRYLVAKRCEESADLCLRATLLVLYEKQAGFSSYEIAERSITAETPSPWLDEQCIARCAVPAEVLVDVVPEWFWKRGEEEPVRVLTDTSVEALAEAARIDLGAAWRADLAGPLTEAFFNLHTRVQLEELAHELAVPAVLQQINKASMVATLLEDEATKRNLPLAIEPVDLSWIHSAASSQPAAKKAKPKGKKK